MLWIKSAQRQLTSQKEFKTIQQQFNLFQDEKGIWRCGGRFSNVEVPFSVKYPVLMPRNHHLTMLIVKDAHGRVHHNGVRETLTEIRSKFWIPRGRSYMSGTLFIIARSVRNLKVFPTRVHRLHLSLPSFCVKEEPAFSFTGVDFAGPLIIRTNQAANSPKVWICLFTCLVVRAVHCDGYVHSVILGVSKKICFQKRFTQKILLNNGKMLRAASKYIKAVFADHVLEEYLAGLGCAWIFNVEYATWWGGAFERMVKSTKRCLRKMIGRAQLTLDELLTAIVEIKAVINSRPLSYISGEDVEEPLTPSHLLVGRRMLSLPDHISCACNSDDDEFTPHSSQLTRRARQLNNALNHFWGRWRTNI